MGIVLAVAFDRVGSAELFLSGLALFFLRDISGRRSLVFFGDHSSILFITKLAFGFGFLILLSVSTFEFAFYPTLPSYQPFLSMTGILGGAFLLFGAGPYLLSLLKSRTPGK